MRKTLKVGLLILSGLFVTSNGSFAETPPVVPSPAAMEHPPTEVTHPTSVGFASSGSQTFTVRYDSGGCSTPKTDFKLELYLGITLEKMAIR